MSDKGLLNAISFLALIAIIAALSYMAFVLNPHSVLPLVAACVNIVLAIFVVAKKPESKLHRMFFLWNLAWALNNINTFGTYVAPTLAFVTVWVKIFDVGYYFLSSTFLHFIIVLTGNKSRTNRVILAVSYCISIALYIITFIGPYKNEFIRTGVKYSPKTHPAYALSMIFTIAVAAYALVVVAEKYQRTTSRERSQYKFFLFAGIAAVVMALSHGFLSLKINIYPLGGFGFTIYSLIIAYAILKHGFLDIEVVIKKSAIYATLTLFVAGGYAAIMLIANAVFSVASPTTSIPLNAVAIVLIAFLFQPLRAGIQTFVDRKFFREKYNYRETLRKFSSDIIKIIGVEELSLRLVNVVTDTVKVENTRLILRDSESGIYEVVAEKNFEQDAAYHPEGSRKALAQPELMAYINEEKGVLDREALAFSMESSSEKEKNPDYARLLNSLENMNAHLLIPVVLKDEVKGLFAIGAKLSEEGFSSQDVELLQIILNQTAVAVENSELYDRTLALKRYYDDIIKSMTSGMLTVDRSGNIVTLNRAGEQILNLSADEVRGKNLQNFPDENREFADVILRVLATDRREKALFDETELEYSNKNRKRLAVTTSPLANMRNETIGAVALFSDITEKKELERQLERGRRLAYMGEMAASIAHEIKNPIGSIRLFVDALARDFSNPVAQKNFKEVIPQEVENIDRMVRDLLFLARPPSLTKVQLDLAEIIKVTLQFCSEDIASKNISLDANLPDGGVEVLADGEKLKQALRNIVLNAVEAVPAGTGNITVNLADEGRTASMAITDNGPGISEEDLPRLFHPFYTTKHGGTGLGLAIANRIVEDHGGSIEVTSRLNASTTFSIVLPKEGPTL